MLNLKIHKIPTFVSQPTMIAALPDMGNVAGMGMTLLTTRLTAVPIRRNLCILASFCNI